MSRDEVLTLLRAHKAVLEQRFGIVDLALFGSFARDRAGDDSDVDILVRFDEPPDWRRYFGAQFYLEDLLGLRSIWRRTRRSGPGYAPMWSGRP